MATRKSIRDIQSSNIISDMVAEEPVAIKIKKVKEITETPVVEDDFRMEEEIPEETPVLTTIGKKKPSLLRRARSILSQIKPLYLILFLIIILGVVALVFIPAPGAKDPVQQAKIEAELVKKQMSKHIILPENEQIDIRKITTKMEDPFFKGAEVGDYLVILYKNRIAYIYSVKKDIIVNAGVVFIDPKTATTTSTTTKKQ